MKEGWYHGSGKLQLDDGVVYEGQFVKGHFHGEGKLLYPNVWFVNYEGRLLQSSMGRRQNDFRRVFF